MARTCHISILLMVLGLLAPIIPLLAGSQYEGWSPEEQSLAKQLGLDLSFQAGRFRVRPIGEQTWLSPWVVEGIVRKIDNDPECYYRTKVRFHVDRYFKGEGPADITLGFAYGLGYTADHKAMSNRFQVPSVVFSEEDVGKRYILFLNLGRILLPSGEELYPRGKDDFDVSNRYWLTVDKALPDHDAPSGARSYSYNEVVSEILRVAGPQTKLSQPKP